MWGTSGWARGVVGSQEDRPGGWAVTVIAPVCSSCDLVTPFVFEGKVSVSS